LLNLPTSSRLHIGFIALTNKRPFVARNGHAAWSLNVIVVDGSETYRSFANEPDIGLPLAPIQLSVMLLTQFPS
jgi:hypothetical protein